MKESRQITAVGSIAFDTIKTPNGSRERLLGGSATYFGIATSYYTKTNLIGVLAKERRDKARGIRAAEATPMEKMMGGGVVKRTRPIDGIGTIGMSKGKIT